MMAEQGRNMSLN